MPATMTKNFPAKTLSAYKKAVADITRFYQTARKSLAEFYWKTGRRIVEVEQDGAVHAHYGEKLLENLSGDLSRRLGPGFSVQNLRKMRQVYLASPKRATSRVLTWSQQVALLPVKNAKLRARLEKKAVREDLTSRQVRALVRAGHRPAGKPKNLSAPASGKKSSDVGTKSLLVPLKGKIGIYRIAAAENQLHWDKGFSAYRELPAAEARRFKDGDFVKLNDGRIFPNGKILHRDGLRETVCGGRLEKVPDGKLADLYTYEANLERVIDADTFWMKVWTARPEWRREKLRLRGIDAPELSTPEGQAAKRFVELLFQKAKAITVTTTKPDKYHRYLSGVFLLMPGGEEIFLNNHLLEKGHASRVDYIPASEWEKE